MDRGHRRYGGRQRDGNERFAGFGEKSSEEQMSLLEAWVEQARAATYEAINSHHRDFIGMRMYGHDPLDEVATLNDKYEAVRTRIGSDADLDTAAAADGGSANPPHSSHSPVDSRAVERLDGIGRALRATVRLAKAHSNLKDVDEQLLRGEIAVAASSVAEANDLLSELDADAAMPCAVSSPHLHVLQTQYLKKRAALRAELDYLLAAMYQYQISSDASVSELTVSFSVAGNYDGVAYEAPITPSDVFFALAELDPALARQKIDALAQPLIDRWFVPLLHNPDQTLAASRAKVSASLGIGAYSAGRKKDPAAVDRDASDLAARCAVVKEKWMRVLEFVCDDMFCDVNLAEDHPELHAYLGTRLWSALRRPLKESLLDPLIPADIADVSDTSAMLPLLELEDAWLERGLIPPDALFVKDSIRALLQMHVSKRRRDLLTVVASVLASDSNTVTVGGEGPVADILGEYGGAGKAGKTKGGKKGGDKTTSSSVGGLFASDDADDDATLSFPRCSISTHAQTLVDFARETIGFSGSDDATAAALHFHAVRDAFALYRCLVPCQARAADALASPKRVFVLYNDCNYICHHLAGLGFRQRARHWPPLMKASATLVDVIASYRALAKSVLTPLLNRLRRQIRRTLASPPSWMHPGWLATACRDPSSLDDAENALALAAEIVAHTAHASAPHLPRATHLRVLGMLSDVVFDCVAQRLEEVGVVGDADARAIVRLVAPAVALQDRFVIDGSESHGSGGMARQPRRIRAPVAKYASHWDQLQTQVSRLQSMADNHHHH
ncbi:ribosome biogenesis protein ytm1 [Coemansia sp. BCRC 34490]|nr:ribosome biogenesis protein ytm1 [Coemansia sp. BCRC 34490]